MGGFEPEGGPNSKPARALGKAVVGPLLATAARRFRDREAFFCAGTGRRFSFGQTNERCNRLSHGLVGLGLKKPDTIAFLCNNRAEMPEIYYALAKTELVGIPLNYRLAPVEIVALMSAMGAKAMLFETRFTAVAEKVRAELPQVQSFVVIGGLGPAWASEYEVLLAESSSAEPDVEVEESDAYYYNLTSGTTGLPKAYVLTQYNNAFVGPMFEAFDMTSHDVILTVFPAFGRVGFAWIAAGVLFGVRNVLMDFHPAETLRLVETERVTISNLVPTMAAMLLADPSLPQRDLRSLRALVFAGAMFPEPLRLRTAASLCPAIYEYYGMQETGTLTVSTPADRKRYPHSIGAPLALSDVRIERPDGTARRSGGARRDRRTLAGHLYRLLRQTSKIRRDFSRRLRAYRRSRYDERGRLRLYQGPLERHDHYRRSKRARRRGRGNSPRHSRSGRLCGVRSTRRNLGRARCDADCQVAKRERCAHSRKYRDRLPRAARWLQDTAHDRDPD